MSCPICRSASANVSPLDQGLCVDCLQALPQLVTGERPPVEWTPIDWAAWGANLARRSMVDDVRWFVSSLAEEA